MTVTYKPLRSDVLVQFIRPTRTAAGLEIVNATFGDAWPRCRVLDVGTSDVGLAAGDVVLVDSSKGYAVNDGLACVPFDGIVCKVEGHSDDDIMEVEPSPNIIEPGVEIVKPNRAVRRAVQAARRH